MQKTECCDITFVCCVESGSLEAQTVRMVESLRRYSGKYAKAPIIAVTPRFGSPLSKKTLRLFDRLEVMHFYTRPQTNYSWFNFLNKPLTLLAAEEYITSEAVCWLDSDLLFVNEPDKLDLLPSEDFLGFPTECKEMGTAGPGDPFEPLWQEFCRVLKMNIDDLPWIITAETQERVRLYFNSGIFVYRRSTDFAKNYLNICLQLLDARLRGSAKGYSEGLKEQGAVGLALVKMGLPWRPLPYSHDYVFSSQSYAVWYNEALLRDAKIIHYHDGMWPAFWPVFQECLHKTHPEVEAWLTKMGPMSNQAPLQWRLFNRILKYIRTRSAKAYYQSCSVI